MNWKLIPILLLAACGGGGGGDKGEWTIDMDPRLANLAAWSYACMLDVTGLAASNTLPVPDVQGVNKPWDDGVYGTYYRGSRSIRVQITRPETHVVNIINHEMGHDGDWRVNGKSTGEGYANWVDAQCREKNMPGIYPAPAIDFDAK